jgi:hypothetical protein
MQLFMGVNGQNFSLHYKVCSVVAKSSTIISTYCSRKSEHCPGIGQKSWGQTSFIPRWNLATADSDATQLSIGTAKGGTGSNTRQEVSPGSATGSGGTTNVFDATVSNSLSVFCFSESAFTGVSNSGCAGFTNTTNTLAPNQALRILYRGPRDQSNILTIASAVNFTFLDSNKSASAPFGTLLRTNPFKQNALQINRKSYDTIFVTNMFIEIEPMQKNTWMFWMLKN